MTSLINPAESPERQNGKLIKISQALMRKVAQNTEQSGFAYHQFERAALLETEVQQRTLELERPEPQDDPVTAGCHTNLRVSVTVGA
ncbi:hypothetical protein FIU94_18610 (plasmid) [Sulfitobacter sp. THAF37]|uniref:hypothetical protein n=1 Tax=Sulfitobacter sp. THAF37 TaxID=2587855 RepID=UPI00126893DA|nr:hypothetical protein FIU94_18610 [Sulfitobacter sp. THAF37]